MLVIFDELKLNLVFLSVSADFTQEFPDQRLAFISSGSRIFAPRSKCQVFGLLNAFIGRKIDIHAFMFRILNKN